MCQLIENIIKYFWMHEKLCNDQCHLDHFNMYFLVNSIILSDSLTFSQFFFFPKHFLNTEHYSFKIYPGI